MATAFSWLRKRDANDNHSRLAGKAGPGFVTSVLNRLYLGVPRLVS